MDVILWGALLRIVQTLAQAAPTIVVGLFVAGVFRYLLGAEKTGRLFGGSSWRALPQAWILGMLLPVCSLGVIPVAREMRRAGISGGTVLAFALTAPLFNPLSLLYGLTLSNPVVILTFALCSLAVITAVGLLWDRLFAPRSVEVVEESPMPIGWRRMVAVGVHVVRDLAGATSGYILIALVGVAVLASVLPAGALQTAMEHDNPWAPVHMALVAIPAYATPMLAMSQVGMMFGHANSIGAAFVLLVLGTGINLGLFAWTARNYGLGRAVAWLVVVVGVVVSLAYAINDPLHPRDIEPAGHTHAFDIYCCPFHAGEHAPAAKVSQTLQEALSRTDYTALGLLASLLLLGGTARVIDPHGKLEAWLQSAPPVTKTRGYDVVLPGSVVAGVTLFGLLAGSVVGCFYYYPAADQALAELNLINTEVAASSLSGNRKQADFFLPLAEDWTRRMQVGVYLRNGQLSRFQQMKARLYCDKLELLEHALADEDPQEVQEHARDVNLAFQRLKVAFRPAD